MYELYILTVRSDYVYITLASLLSSDWFEDVNVCLGVANGNYITKYFQKGSRIKLKRLHTRKSYNTIKSWPPARQVTYNFSKILRGVNPRTKGIFVFEDDIIVNPDWFTHAQKTISKIEKVSNEFILSLYSPHGRMQEGEDGFAEYPIKRFFGTQAMYYQPSTANRFGQFLRMGGYAPGHDIEIHRFCEEGEIPIYVPNRITVQHIGKKSLYNSSKPMHASRKYRHESL